MFADRLRPAGGVSEATTGTGVSEPLDSDEPVTALVEEWTATGEAFAAPAVVTESSHATAHTISVRERRTRRG